MNRKISDYLRSEPGGFWLLRGYPDTGKTALVLQSALILAEEYRVGYFTLETDCERLADRLVHLDNCQEHLSSKLNLDLITACGMTAHDIQGFALNKQYQIIFIDYLQLVASAERTRYERDESTSQTLRILAQSHGMMVVALSRLPRPAKRRGAGDE